MKSLFAFWKGGLGNLRQTGALLPSSRSLSRVLTAPLRNRPGPVRVLEAGAGTGAITREILETLNDGDSLVVYEMNPAMRQALEKVVAGTRAGGNSGPEVKIVSRAVETIDPGERFDHIITGLPFNNFTPEKVDEILELLSGVCRDAGTLSYFEYIGMRAMRRIVGGPAASTISASGRPSPSSSSLRRRRISSWSTGASIAPRAYARTSSRAAFGGA